MIENLRQRAMRHLLTMNPVTHKGYETYLTSLLPSPRIDGERWPYFHPSLVINLARDIQADFLLPCAFFRLSTRTPQTNFVDLAGTSGRSLLSREDLEKHVFFEEFTKSFILRFVGEYTSAGTHRSDNCKHSHSPTCELAFKSLIPFFLRTLCFEGALRGPDGILERTIVYFRDNCQPRACSACRRDFADDLHRRRKRLWESLPSALGLPKWEELVPEEYI